MPELKIPDMSGEEEEDFISKRLEMMISAIQGKDQKEILYAFSKLMTNAQRFAFVWVLPQLHEVIKIEPEYKAKSDEESLKHRQAGNKYFGKKSYLSALESYNASVLYASPAPLEGAGGPPQGPGGDSDTPKEGENVQPKQEDEKQKATPRDDGDKATDGDAATAPPTAETDKAKDDAAATAPPTAETDKGKDGAAATAPPAAKTDNMLALAYGNRSAALFHLQWYGDCLVDIETALAEGYPEQAAYKLHYRRAQCHARLAHRAAALASLDRALQLLDAAPLDDKGRALWTNTMTKDRATYEKITEAAARGSGGGGADGSTHNVATRLPKLSGTPNECFPNVDSNVEVKYTKKKGRHLVAAEDINVGDVVVSEKAYAAVLFEEHRANHCSNCFAKTRVPFPCVQCTGVVFCSPACRDAAWKSFHRYECKHGEVLCKTICAKIGHLALRLVLRTGARKLIYYLEDRQIRKLEEGGGGGLDAGKDSRGVYTGDYHTVHSLNTHAKARLPPALFDFSVFAALLMNVIKQSGFLRDGGQEGEDLDTEQNMALVGGELIHTLEMIQCNALRVQEVQRPHNFEDPHPVNLGIGIYPSAALVNHACDPVADFLYYDDSVAVRAIRRIRKGEEVACSYGPLFYTTRIKERCKALNDVYSFLCQCTACCNNWPITELLEDTVFQFICQVCGARLDTGGSTRRHVTCKRCKHTLDLEEVVGRLQLSHDQFGKAMADAWNDKVEQALPNFVEHLLLLQTHVAQPWKDFTSCQAAVRQCYRLLANRKL